MGKQNECPLGNKCVPDNSGDCIYYDDGICKYAAEMRKMSSKNVKT